MGYPDSCERCTYRERVDGKNLCTICLRFVVAQHAAYRQIVIDFTTEKIGKSSRLIRQPEGADMANLLDGFESGNAAFYRLAQRQDEDHELHKA